MNRRPPVVMGLFVMVLVAAVLVVGRSGRATATPRPPVLGPVRVAYNGDLGDPFVLPVMTGGSATGFVAYGTGDWPARIPTARSSDLVTWQKGPDALPDLPGWARPDEKHSLSWAPAVLDTGHGLVMYVTLPDAGSGQQCIAVAAAGAPEGPYAGVGDGPLLCQHDLGGSIDPAVTRDHAGGLHLLWKDEGNTRGRPSSLWEQALTADGLGLAGVPHRLLSARQRWENKIIEEPAVTPAADGGWWLFYSGNHFDTPGYATGLAYCPSLEGPCRDISDRPFLATAGLGVEGQSAPGGLETFRDGHGALWAVLDTWNRPVRNGRFRCCRSVLLAEILSV
ncbi:MAG TPA: glycoside hydrolase family 43 protein [Acidimicrobiia bacterium]|nr:glycoside hydrolase family 43 protein [Acidimicrobiia bacterium]